MGNSHALAYEVERALYEFSSTWEGIDAQDIPLDVGEVILRIEPGFAAAAPLRFHTQTVATSLDQAIEQVESIVPWCLWVIGPSSQPHDLQQRFMARGFSVRWEWEGLALEDLSLPLPSTPGLSIEPLSWSNAEEYAIDFSGDTDASYRQTLLAQADRFLRRSPQEAQIHLARLDIKRGFKPVCRIIGLARKRSASAASNVMK